MKDLINKYIEAHTLAWTEATIRAERSRLNSVAYSLNGDPLKLWAAIEKKAPYTRLTTWIRVINFWEWLIESELMTGKNNYKLWRQTNARQFKHVYERKTPQVGYLRAERLIHKIQDKEVRNKCLQLLRGGLRYSESFTVDEQGYVTGKGGKKRKAFVGPCGYKRSHSYLSRTLMAVAGLTPHMLRKIRATDLAKRGMKEADLCQAFGWSSFETAKCYIAPMKEKEMEEMFK